jgi:hypothetical protein
MRLSSIFYFSEREVKFSSIKKIKKNSKKNKKLNKTYTLLGMINMIWGRGFGRKLGGGRVWDALEKG